MKILLVSLFIVMIFSNVLYGDTMVNQYFRYKDNEKHHRLGVKKENKYYDLGICNNIDQFLKLISYTTISFKIEDNRLLDPNKIVFDVPFPLPSQIVAAALNFSDHQDETNIHIKPIFFPKFSQLTNFKQNIILDKKVTSLLDYEVEWGFLIKKDINKDELSSIKSDNLEEYIAGVFLILDMSARDIQVRKSKLLNEYYGYAIAKGLPTYAPVSQYFIIYKDFLRIKDNFKMSLHMNNKLKQNSDLSKMILWPIELIKEMFVKKNRKRKFLADLTGREVTAFNGVLKKGDVVITGTPSGMLFKVPDGKVKWKAFLHGVRVGRPISGAKDYIISKQSRHLEVGDTIVAKASYLGEMKLKIIGK